MSAFITEPSAVAPDAKVNVPIFSVNLQSDLAAQVDSSIRRYRARFCYDRMIEDTRLEGTLIGI